MGAGLAGAAAVGTLPNAPGAKPSGVPAAPQESQKKGIDPKIIAVGGFLAVAALAAFFITGAMGKTDPETITPVDPSGGSTTLMSPGSSSTGTTNVPTLGGGGGGGGGGDIKPAVVAFQLVTPPNPEFQTGTMGILVGPNVPANQAMGFARTARAQYERNGKWSKMQICVFADKTAAASFASYQSKRRGAPLEPTDFIQLGTSVWSGAPAYLESVGKNEKIFSPTSSPTTWWQRR